jgi:hypothetical protein
MVMNRTEQFHFGRAQHHFQSGNTSHALRHLHLSGTHFGADEQSAAEEEKPKEDGAALYARYPPIAGECECGCGQTSNCDFVAMCMNDYEYNCGSVLAIARKYFHDAKKKSKDGKLTDEGVADIKRIIRDVLESHISGEVPIPSDTGFGRRRHNPGFGVCATCGR